MKKILKRWYEAASAQFKQNCIISMEVDIQYFFLLVRYNSLVINYIIE